MAEVYRLDFPNGKSYVGITRGTAQQRFAAHNRAARNSNMGVVYAAWRKHGAPALVVLAIVEDEDMYDTERRAVSVYGTRFPDGYNFTDGGDVPPSLNPDVARKISAALVGRQLSDDHRVRISQGLQGMKHTASARANMAVAQKGKVFTSEARSKMAAAKIGRTLPDDVRAKMSASQRARRAKEGCTPQRWRYR